MWATQERTSQSHHFGIETKLQCREVLEMIISQSHHFGIETENWSIDTYLEWGSQSHHFGIETVVSFFLFFVCLTLNRTILELKRFAIDIQCNSINSLNRTILELKLVFDTIDKPEQVLSIAPFWNWNKIFITNNFLILNLSIAPFWNWN